MTWHKDGSGLEVKRVRGMTLRCWMVARENELREDHGTIPGFWSSVDIGRRYTKQRRKDRRARRAKRQAKAAEKRVRRGLQRLLNAVRSMGIDFGPNGLEVLTAAALDVGLCARRIEAWRMPRVDHA